MLIISLEYSKHSDNVVEIMFQSTNNDWFTALFPLTDVEFDKMKSYYIGRDFYETKTKYEGRVFSEKGKYDS